ncbi:MAG: TetR family transcriptional regulator [Acidimicrobiales bacterium]|nr:TetR family transcriptional regulator [Acidimicrobiales bacterium]
MAPAAPPDESVDRRARRRQRTRNDIARIAVRLTAERGYDHVTVDDIAEAADIAPRTFFRSFPSKDDGFFLDHDERMVFLRQALADRPTGEPIRASVRAAVLALAEHVDDDQEAFRAKSLLIRQVPSLRARSADRTGEWQRVLAEGVAQRLGTDAERDLRAQVIAASTVAALQAAVQVWLSTGGEATVHDVVAEALDLITEA